MTENQQGLGADEDRLFAGVDAAKATIAAWRDLTQQEVADVIRFCAPKFGLRVSIEGSTPEMAPVQAAELDARTHAGEVGGDGSPSAQIGRAASSWASRYNVPIDRIEEVFHFAGDGFEVIVDAIPGRSTREQTQNAYLLTGIAGLLATDEAKFADKDARAFCRQLDCYDPSNHAGALKSIKRLVTGSKSTGLSLTGPGKSAAADLVKQLIEANE